MGFRAVCYWLAVYSLIQSSCGKSEADTLKELIVEQIEAFADTYNSGDLQSLVNNFYTKKATFIAQGQEEATGRPAIKKIFENFKQNIKTLEFEVLEVEGFTDENLFHRERFEGKDANGAVVFKGRGIATWKKVDGIWLLHKEMVNA